MTISKILSSIIENGKLIIKILASGSSDVKTAFNISPFGIDSNPTKDYRAIYANTEVKGEKVLLGIFNENVLTDIGEIRIYSEDSPKNQSFYIHLKNDGTCEIGGDSNFMVRFNELETGFNELKDDHNSLVTAFNSHVHPTAAVGPPSVPTPVPGTIPVSSSDANITNAKIDNILTN